MILILQVLVKVLTKAERDLGSFPLSRSHCSSNEIKLTLPNLLFHVRSLAYSKLKVGTFLRIKYSTLIHSFSPLKVQGFMLKESMEFGSRHYKWMT